MTGPPRPIIDCDQRHAGMAVTDLAAAIDYDSHGSYRFVEG